MLLETNIHSNIVLLRVVKSRHMSGLGNKHAQLTRDVMLLETNIHSNIVLLRVVETSHMSGLGNDHALLSPNATITVTTGKTTVIVVLLANVIPAITFAVPLS